MTMQTDVLSTSLAASGSVFGARTRVRGVIITPGASAGSLTLLDGGSGGTSKMVINTPAAGQAFYVKIPGEGVLFSTNVYATISNCSITVFYG